MEQDHKNMNKETIKLVVDYVLLTIITLAGTFCLIAFGLAMLAGKVH